MDRDSKGHTKDNVVPCCYDCNCARNDNFSHEEMVILGKTISEIKSKRSKTLKQNNMARKRPQPMSPKAGVKKSRYGKGGKLKK